MKKDIPPIENFMTPAPWTIGPERPLTEAHVLMRHHKIRHLPVVRDGELVGIVSERDLHLLETLKGVDMSAAVVQDAMTPEPYTVAPNTPTSEVCREMARHKIGSAVVTRARAVVGIVTSVDLLAGFAFLLEGGDASQPLGLMLR